MADRPEVRMEVCVRGLGDGESSLLRRWESYSQPSRAQWRWKGVKKVLWGQAVIRESMHVSAIETIWSNKGGTDYF